MSVASAPLLSDWQTVHGQIKEHAKRRAGLDYEEGLLLLRARRAGVAQRLGFSSFEEYVASTLGYDAHTTRERLRVAESLAELPRLAGALRGGEVNWSCVRELTRVAVPETEEEWLAVSRGQSVRHLEALVSGHVRGDRPTDPQRPSSPRRVLRFEVTPETFALFREAESKVQRASGGQLDSDELLLAMARQVLGGPLEEGRAPYQVAVTVCPECRRGSIGSRGEPVTVGPEVVEMAECDAQRLAVNDGQSSSHRGRPASQSVPPRVRREVMRRDHGQCQVPGCRNTHYVDIHHLCPLSEGGGHDASNLLVLCTAHHRAVHKGTLWLEGTVSQGLVFRHADKTAYGGDVDPGAAGAYADALVGLRQLGFRETEARSALMAARSGLSSSVTAEDVLRAALARSWPRSQVREQRAAYRVRARWDVGGGPIRVESVPVRPPPPTARRAFAPAPWPRRKHGLVPARLGTAPE
jgi:hypothetical protein